MLDFQLIDVKFTQGMDTRSNKKLVIPGKWNLLRDCTQSGDGTLQKRDGRVAMLRNTLGNGLATFNNELLTVSGTTVRSISSPTLQPASVLPTAVQMPGQLGFVDVRKQDIDRGGDFPEGADVAHGQGFTCYVWTSYTAAGAYLGAYMAILDEATGTRVIQKTLMNALGLRPRVVFSVDAFFIFFLTAAGANLWCRVVRTATGVPVVGADVALITSIALANENFDCCEFGASTVGSVGLSYQWADGLSSVKAIRVTQTAGVPAIATGPVVLITEVEIPVANLRGLGVCFITSQAAFFSTFVFAIAGGTTSGTVVKILDNTFASAAAFLQVDATVPAGANDCHVAAVGQSAFPVACCFTDQQGSIAAAAGVQPLRRTEISFVAGVITVLTTATLINSTVCPGGGVGVLAAPRGPFISGKPIAAATWDTTGAGAFAAGALLLPVAIIESHTAASVNTTNLQPTIFLLDATTGAVVGKALYGTYGVGQLLAVPIVYTPSSTPSIAAFSSTDFETWALAAGERGVLQFSSGVNTTQHGVTRLAFTPRRRQAPVRAELGAATYFAGGSLSMYDAQGVTEVGFPLFPEGIMAVVAAGGALPVGTYQAVAVYEWVDGQGQRHQSAPSLPVSFTTTGGNQTVTLTAPTLLLSLKPGVTIVFFVTQDAGTVFNRLTPMTAPILNSTAVAFVAAPALAGATSITAVAGNELLYTQPLQAGTTLPNDAPGPTSVLGVHQNRLFVDVTDKPGTYRYSQLVIPGLGLQWNETLGGTLPVEGGKLVGFCALDEKILLFCQSKIYVVTGTGPNAAGGYNNYSDPVDILSDVGCSEARSILKLPSGVVFKSAKGWHRVGRDLQVQYIGDGAAAYDGWTVFAATYLKDRQEARFSCGFSFHFGGAGTTEAGVTLVYSYLEDQWSTSVYNVTPAAGAAYTFVGYDTIWWDALGVFMSISLIDGLNWDTPGVYVDSPGQGFAASTPIIMLARTSFLHLGALEGYQRVRWLYLTATYPSGTAVPIGVKFTVDYDDVYSAVTAPGAPGTYTTTALQAVTTYGAGFTIDFRHKLHRQKCKSVAFTFENANVVFNNSLITGFQALALEVGTKRGTNKLAATQTVA